MQAFVSILGEIYAGKAHSACPYAIRKLSIPLRFRQRNMGIKTDFLLPSERMTGALSQIIGRRSKLQQNAYVGRFNRTVRAE